MKIMEKSRPSYSRALRALPLSAALAGVSGISGCYTSETNTLQISSRNTGFRSPGYEIDETNIDGQPYTARALASDTGLNFTDSEGQTYSITPSNLAGIELYNSNNNSSESLIAKIGGEYESPKVLSNPRNNSEVIYLVNAVTSNGSITVNTQDTLQRGEFIYSTKDLEERIKEHPTLMTQTREISSADLGLKSERIGNADYFVFDTFNTGIAGAVPKIYLKTDDPKIEGDEVYLIINSDRFEKGQVNTTRRLQGLIYVGVPGKPFTTQKEQNQTGEEIQNPEPEQAERGIEVIDFSKTTKTNK